MKNSFINLLAEQYGIALNLQQQKSLFHKDGPGLVLAVPGAGKTTLLICRTAYLILVHNINPRNILSVTFSKASARDMSHRFQQLFKDITPQEVHFSTIHSFAYSVLRQFAVKQNIRYTFIEQEKQSMNKARLLKHIYREIHQDYLTEDKLEELSNAISYIKNMMISRSQIHTTAFEIDRLTEIYTQYENYKKNRFLIDFDDMLCLALDILQKNPSTLDRYRQQYPYIQVDEAQDTSKIQHEIIRLLAAPSNNLFMVADDDQSIYGFRGAFPEVLLRFREDYPTAKLFYLEQNYRSTQDIVHVSNRFISQNQHRYPKKLFTENPAHQPIEILSLQDEEDQLAYLTDELKHILPASTAAILYRNNLSAVPVLEMLDRCGIPFCIRDTKLHFFKHWVVQDILAFLDLSMNHFDLESFERIYYKMNRYVTKAAVDYVKSKHNKQSVFDSLIQFSGFPSYQKERMADLKKSFTELAAKTPLEALLFIENDLNYNDYLQINSKRLKYSYATLQMILSNLKRIASHTGSFIEFLERLHQLPGLMEASKQLRKNAVYLSTIHSAKGLEFDHVFIIDLVDGQFPTASSTAEQAAGNSTAMEEERRLFYVAMTRARSNLKLLSSSFYNGAPVKPSPFLKEVKGYISLGLQNKKGLNLRADSSPLWSHIVKPFSKKKTLPHPFFEGAAVHHASFGEGIIKEIRQDVLSVDFNKIGLRSLSLNLCIEKQLLTLIQSP
ncbi:DNA helicase-2 / ATP-dependent DNA helicase PcrA [Geosporobacter subterraneus DSM 17957]|uniref:DNA 3'-5' helicase n=1 Tax=Geosporobacter subterraneus DSM 17957 TaxID=1121919 RepID=A0A1M6D3U5_9FIRM|nr:ATP-dependent helicase [Geosporobacter subterraneus]SHI67764.1 DNA helicase-2 / ATP-dependent DNA helicase PcrA [Geosporobacter subterraneus DSM 17957]